MSVIATALLDRDGPPDPSELRAALEAATVECAALARGRSDRKVWLAQEWTWHPPSPDEPAIGPKWMSSHLVLDACEHGYALSGTVHWSSFLEDEEQRESWRGVSWVFARHLGASRMLHVPDSSVAWWTLLEGGKWSDALGAVRRGVELNGSFERPPRGLEHHDGAAWPRDAYFIDVVTPIEPTIEVARTPTSRGCIALGALVALVLATAWLASWPWLGGSDR